MNSGSNGCIYIFEDELYRNSVLPEFKLLVKTGETMDWYNELYRRLVAMEDCILAPELECFSNKGLSFDDVCSYLDTDLAFTGRPVHKWSTNWNKRACKSQTCPARMICPLHKMQDQHQAEAFNYFFERCVVYKCVGQRAIIGQDVSPALYLSTVLRMRCEHADMISEYLKKLEYRGFVVGYSFNDENGIHGWLSVAETQEFYDLLKRLQLPEYELSFEALSKARRSLRNKGVAKADRKTYFQDQFGLARLRTVVGIAAKRGKGVLWGNDLLDAWTEDESILYTNPGEISLLHRVAAFQRGEPIDPPLSRSSQPNIEMV